MEIGSDVKIRAISFSSLECCKCGKPMRLRGGIIIVEVDDAMAHLAALKKSRCKHCGHEKAIESAPRLFASFAKANAHIGELCAELKKKGELEIQLIFEGKAASLTIEAVRVVH